MKQRDSQNDTTRYTSIKIKIFIPIILLIFLSNLLLYFLIIQRMESGLRSIIEDQISNFSHSVSHNISYVMAAGQMNEIKPILDNLKENRSIINVRITDPTGNIFRGTKPGEQKMQIPFDDSKTESYFIRYSSYYRAYTVLENKAECHRCHGSKNAINGVLITDISLQNFLGYSREIKEYFLLISVLIGIPLIMIIIVSVNWTVMRPINLLKESIETVKKGNLNAMTEYESKDEMGDLIEGFNQMIIKIETLYQEIEILYNKEIQRAGQIALAGELAVGLVHEIRNPLSGIRGAIEVLKDDAEFDHLSKQILSEILNEIDRVNKILNDLLQYAKPKDLELTKLNLNELISQTILLAQNQVVGKEIVFNYKNPNESVHIKADPLKLQQVLLNLFINSIQSIKEQGVIEIKEKISNNHVELQVSDTGQGIPEDKLAFIFKPFFTTKPKGTGLGLSLSKQIIEQHDGEIWAESKIDTGTTIFISLPLWG